MEDLKVINIREFPDWLYQSSVFINTMKSGEELIFYESKITIPDTDHIKTSEDFFNVVNCCEYFGYQVSGMGYPFSAFAFFFMNFKDIDRNCSEEFANQCEIYKDASILDYAFKHKIEECTREWNVKIFPILHNIRVSKIDRSLQIFSVLDENCKTNIKFDQRKMKAYGIYFLYHSYFEYLFQSFYFKFFIENYRKNNSTIKDKIINIFVSYYRLREDLIAQNLKLNINLILYNIVFETQFMLDDFYTKSFIECTDIFLNHIISNWSNQNIQNNYNNRNNYNNENSEMISLFLEHFEIE